MAIDFTEKAKRYQAIDEIIASGRKLKWNQIISELDEKYNIQTSRTSFFRDIAELQEKYFAPIDTDFETNGYFYTDPKYRLPRFYTDENAAKAAKLIKSLMDLVKGNPLYKEAQEVFESLAIENHDLSIENIKINKKPENDRIIFSVPQIKIFPQKPGALSIKPYRKTELSLLITNHLQILLPITDEFNRGS